MVNILQNTKKQHISLYQKLLIFKSIKAPLYLELKTINKYNKRYSSPYCFIVMTTWQDNRREVGWQLGTSCVFESPTLASEVSLRGIKWMHEMNPEQVQLFRIRHVIGRTKPVPGLKTTRSHYPEVGSFLANHGLSKA